MSGLFGLAPMAGRFTHGSVAGKPAQPPKGCAVYAGFKCSPLVSHASRRPSWSVSVTGVLVTMASHVRQIWLSEEVNCVFTVAACAARLSGNVGASQRFPDVPVNGLPPVTGLLTPTPLMRRVSV